ncbi:MAG: shikimate dehydrogenase [Rhodothermales bacterium]|nr:shikimate dehydrogenase [Rhodothermales bacterium]
MTDGAWTIDGGTVPVGLLGDPVAHSRSPRIHNAAFRAQGLPFVYVALPVRPADVAAAVRGLAALGFAGANVTVPHKQAVLPLLDTLSEQARAVGAVNTIVCRREDEAVTLHGDNTDVAGFLAPLGSEDLEGAEMLLFGGGGAARAATYALLTAFRPARLTLAARTPARAEALARDLAPYDVRGALRVVPPAEAAPAVRAARLLVNTTPLGMHPNPDGTPWPAAGFHPGQLVYDLVYEPAWTRLLREAAAAGAQTLGGLEMLIQQAAAAYVQWTGRAMPLEAVRTALARDRPTTS